MVKEFNELIGKTILELDVLQVRNSKRICNHSVDGESNGCYSCEVMTEYTNPNDDILFKYELNPWGDEV